MLKNHIAKKDHECSECGRKIPAGHRYFRRHDDTDTGRAAFLKAGDHKEHTNCELYKGKEYEIK